MPKFEPCPGATSDHAWRSVAITVFPGIRLQGATWNMQMRCISKEHAVARAIECKYDLQYAHSNNPLDITEEQAEYSSRKIQQLDELKTIMDMGNEFILLQEADWVKSSVLKREYLAFLKTQGWALIETPVDNKGQQLLVTLYNTRKLRPVPRSGKGMFPGHYNCRGYRHDFTDVITGKPIALINLHLEYGHDYSQEMIDAQFALVRENIPSIMGGDTNNIQNVHLKSMVSSWHHATNICSDGRGGLTTVHESGGSGARPVQKAYDGFFVAPDRGSFVQVEDKPGKFFEDLGGGVVAYKDYIPDPAHAVHQTLRGRPWQRFKDILLDYDVILGHTMDPAEQTKLRTQMNNIGSAYLGAQTWAEFAPTLPVYSGKVAPFPAPQASGSGFFCQIAVAIRDALQTSPNNRQ